MCNNRESNTTAACIYSIRANAVKRLQTVKIMSRDSYPHIPLSFHKNSVDFTRKQTNYKLCSSSTSDPFNF